MTFDVETGTPRLLTVQVFRTFRKTRLIHDAAVVAIMHHVEPLFRYFFNHVQENDPSSVKQLDRQTECRSTPDCRQAKFPGSPASILNRTCHKVRPFARYNQDDFSISGGPGVPSLVVRQSNPSRKPVSRHFSRTSSLAIVEKNCGIGVMGDPGMPPNILVTKVFRPADLLRSPGDSRKFSGTRYFQPTSLGNIQHFSEIDF